METAFSILTVLLSVFAILGIVDGLYLHLIRYRLYQHTESQTEHITHTLRAILFPGIVYFLFVRQNCVPGFYIGLALVALDVIVLFADAWIEKDSRRFMGGLPRWEYILHLFVNGFHFASVALFLAVKIKLQTNGLTLVENFDTTSTYPVFRWVAVNVIPGAIALAALHIWVSIPKGAIIWTRWSTRIKCC